MKITFKLEVPPLQIVEEPDITEVGLLLICSNSGVVDEVFIYPGI